MKLFVQYIEGLENDGKKKWLVANIHKMPYEEDYQPFFVMDDPSDPYYQGIDRIGGYLKYSNDW